MLAEEETGRAWETEKVSLTHLSSDRIYLELRIMITEEPLVSEHLYTCVRARARVCVCVCGEFKVYIGYF